MKKQPKANTPTPSLSGSIFIKGYSNFQYKRFLSSFGTTRFSIFFDSKENLFLILIAFSDKSSTRTFLEDKLKQLSSDILEYHHFRTWKACLDSLESYKRENDFFEDDGLKLVEGKRYISKTPSLANGS